jgi:uncharacterized protein (DUF3084 family)
MSDEVAIEKAFAAVAERIVLAFTDDPAIDDAIACAAMLREYVAPLFRDLLAENDAIRRNWGIVEGELAAERAAKEAARHEIGQLAQQRDYLRQSEREAIRERDEARAKVERLRKVCRRMLSSIDAAFPNHWKDMKSEARAALANHGQPGKDGA